MLLSQNGFKSLLSAENLLDKFRQYLYHNRLKNFNFTHFLLIKDYGKYSLRKESVIAPFVEWFKTPREQTAPRKGPVIALFVEQLKTYFEDI